jgi:hypothetical protein
MHTPYRKFEAQFTSPFTGEVHFRHYFARTMRDAERAAFRHAIARGDVVEYVG